MDDVTLTPDLERFAAEVVASGRYRDRSAVVSAGLDLLRRQEAARAALLASVLAAEAEADREGCKSIEAVEQEMLGAIRAAARSAA